LRLRHLHNPFYGETKTLDRFLHILHFLHFADNSQRPDQDEKYDRPWKLRTVFDKLNIAYAKFYDPSEHVTVDEVILIFKGRVIFRQYIPKQRKSSGIKIYKLYVELGYTYDKMTAKHATVRHLTCRVEGLGQKIFMDNFCSPQDFLMTQTDVK